MEQLGHPGRRKWIKELSNAPFWSARAQDSPVWVGHKHRDGAELRAGGGDPGRCIQGSVVRRKGHWQTQFTPCMGERVTWRHIPGRAHCFLRGRPLIDHL